MKKKANFISIVLAGIICIETVYLISQKEYLKVINKKYLKFKKYYQLFNKWLQNKENSIQVTNQLIQSNYKKIAIYGSGEIGSRLYQELENSEIKVICFLDKAAKDIVMEYEGKIEIMSLEHLRADTKEIECIVITPIHDFKAISDEIKEICDIPILSIEDIVYQD